ncbi:MAG: hypothetical protein ACRDN9_04385 [Streptosporangiaceae bacterium]
MSGTLHVRHKQGAPTWVGEYLIPPRFTVVYTDDGPEPGFEIDFEVRDGVPQCRAVRIACSRDGDEIQRRHLRDLRLEDFREWAMARVALVVQEIHENGDTVATPPADVKGMRDVIHAGRGARADARRTVTDERLHEVADIYRDNPKRPTAAVADHFGKSLRTASWYVKLTREAGYLQ